MKAQNNWKQVLTTGLLTLAAMAFAGILLAAQEPSAPSNPPQDQAPAPNGNPGRGGMVENRLQKLSQQLNLTDDQREKIRPLLEHESERIKEVRGNSSLSQGEAQRRIKSIRRDTNQRIGAFLTPEQIAQWKEDRQQHRGGGQGAEHGPSGGPAPDAPPAPNNQN
jgi:Spy/CpxP family protein refolding chaperone